MSHVAGAKVVSSSGGSGGSGLNQLTGDVTAGPGTGSQAATLVAVGTAGTYGNAAHTDVITTDTKGRVTTIISTLISIVSAQVSDLATTLAAYLRLSGGTMTGAIAMGANKITGLANGSASSDAAAFGQIPTTLPPNGAAGGDLSGTYPNPTLQATANVIAIIAANSPGAFGSATYAASGTAGINESSLFTGSTTAQTITLPVPSSGNPYNQIQNNASVPVTYAPGAGATINNDGVVGSLTIPAGYAARVVYLSTVWYVVGGISGPAVNQLTGDVLAGPGGASQVATLQNTANVKSVIAANALLTQVNASTSGAISANVGDIVNTTAAATVTLPAAPTIGKAVLINRGNHTATVTITANTGQSINGGAAAGSISMPGGNSQANVGQCLFVAQSTTAWTMIASLTDAGLGIDISGQSNLGVVNINGISYQGQAVTFYGGNTHTSAYATSTSGDCWVRATANSWTLTLTSGKQGQIVLVTNEGPGVITVVPSSGTLAGVATIPAGGGVIYGSDGTSWHTVSAWDVGANSSQYATVTTPTLGAAAQLAQTTQDAMLYITVGVAGTLTIAIGPTVSVTTVVLNGLAASVGNMYSVRLPAGWYVKVATSTTATWSATAITC